MHSALNFSNAAATVVHWAFRPNFFPCICWYTGVYFVYTCFKTTCIPAACTLIYPTKSMHPDSVRLWAIGDARWGVQWTHGKLFIKVKKKKKKEEKDQCNTQLVKTILKADHNKFKFVWQGGLRIIKANKIQEDKNSKS